MCACRKKLKKRKVRGDECECEDEGECVYPGKTDNDDHNVCFSVQGVIPGDEMYWRVRFARRICREAMKDSCAFLKSHEIRKIVKRPSVKKSSNDRVWNFKCS